jgi:hypothetical protein
LGGGGSKQTTEVKDTTPWTAQQPYLTDAFSQAKSIYDSTKNNGPYTGDFFAQPTPDQINTFTGALNYANGAGATAAGALTNTGQQQLASGSAATQGALSGLQNYNNTDWTGTNIANAQRYAAGEDVDGLVSAGMKDAYRVAGENTLPTLYRNSAASGNLDGSRQALSEGVIQRGLNDQAQSLRAQLGSQAYTTGLTNAHADQAGILSGLNAQGALGNSTAAQGAANIGSGLSSQAGLYDLASGASDKLQSFDQSAIDNARAKYDYAQQFPYQNLDQYMQIVGGQNWGSHTTGTSVTEDKPSALSSIGSAIGIGGSLFKMFCDERLKTVLLRDFGKTHSGVPLHVFFYNDDPERRLTIGPMAQEVRKTHPDAVMDHAGVLLVDIGKLV